MRTKFVDKILTGFATCVFGGITWMLCWGMYTTMMYSFTHGASDGFPLFMLLFTIPLWILLLFTIPAMFFVTLMFAGWTFGKDIFKIEGDKYDQVEMNFKEK
jgi:hypothetical protein